jgi:ribose 1,5-bisphosphate isomerase
MKTVKQIVKDIKSLKIQGARDVAKAGIECIRITAKKSRAKNKREFVRDVQKTVDLVVKARPTEPMLKNGINMIMLRVSEHDFENIKEFTARLCDNYFMEMKAVITRIAEQAANQIEDGDTILTHCHSHDVVEAFRLARKQGRKFEVIVTETRPRMQGVRTARELMKEGIKVTFCVDSAIGYVMKNVHKIFVGCDAIMPDGSIVNKIGTFPIAVMAMHFARPFYVLAETMKYSPRVHIEHRDPKEIIRPSTLPKADIIDPAFDVTPGEYVHVIITERGLMRPDAIKDLISANMA